MKRELSSGSAKVNIHLVILYLRYTDNNRDLREPSNEEGSRFYRTSEDLEVYKGVRGNRVGIGRFPIEAFEISRLF